VAGEGEELRRVVRVLFLVLSSWLTDNRQLLGEGI